MILAKIRRLKVNGKEERSLENNFSYEFYFLGNKCYDNWEPKLVLCCQVVGQINTAGFAGLVLCYCSMVVH